MKAKHIFTVFLLSGLMLISPTVRAQQTKMNLQEHDHNRYHFGFFVATNQMDFSIKTNTDLIGITYDPTAYNDFANADYIQFYGVHSEPSMGFTVGIIGNLKITKYLDLRFVPSLSFGERSLIYSFRQHVSGSDPEMVTVSKNITSTYIDLPFYIKYKSKRVNNFRAYVLSGIKFSIDMAANSDQDNQEVEDFLSLNSNDLLFEAGVGIDYYFNFFKFGIELKMAYGFNNLIATEGNVYSDAIKSIHSKIFQLSLTFE